MAKKKRRTRSPHPGVKLIKRAHRSGATSWAARWVDPDDGRPAQTSLDALLLTTHEARRDWAIRKSKELAQRRADLATGATRKTDKKLVDAVADYFKTAAVERNLRERTVELYRDAVDTFRGWCEGQHLHLTADLRPETLVAFRKALATRPRNVVAKGGRRGERQPTTDRVPKPTTTNKRLRAVATFLTDLRRLRLTPWLTSDDIRDGLRPLKQPKPRPSCLRPAQLKALVLAALRHDADTFDLTREEKARGLAASTTPRYPPIAPFLATVLLSGMRAGEAMALRTDSLCLDEVAGTGGAGEVLLRPEDVKTAHARAIDLVVSPALASLLGALKLRAGDAPYLFGGAAPLSRDIVEVARKRLIGKRTRKLRGRARGVAGGGSGAPPVEGAATRTTGYGAPSFTWQMLRQTCASYLTNAGGIFGAASVFKSARQLGHSVAVAERHYLGVVNVATSARSLDEAMGVDRELALVVATVPGATKARAEPTRPAWPVEAIA